LHIAGAFMSRSLLSSQIRFGHAALVEMSKVLRCVTHLTTYCYSMTHFVLQRTSSRFQKEYVAKCGSISLHQTHSIPHDRTFVMANLVSASSPISGS
jgi:hypothetical protein